MEIMDVVDIYFGKEKAGSVILLVLSGLAVGLGGLFWWQHKAELFQGAIPPLLVLGLMAGVVGAIIFFRTDSQVEALKKTYHEAAQTFVSEEQGRMSTVNRNWAFYKWFEIAIIICSLSGLLLASRHDYWVGCALAALVMATFLLVFDVVSERNGRWYAAKLDKLSHALIIDSKS